MSFVNFSIKLLLPTGGSKAPLKRIELGYFNAMFNNAIFNKVIYKENPLIKH